MYVGAAHHNDAREGAIIETVNEAGLRSQVKIMVEGAPVSEAFTERIGADGYPPDAARVVEAAGDLVPK